MELQYNCPETGKIYIITSEEDLGILLKNGILKPSARVYDSEAGRLIKLNQIQSFHYIVAPYLEDEKDIEVRENVVSENTINPLPPVSKPIIIPGQEGKPLKKCDAL